MPNIYVNMAKKSLDNKKSKVDIVKDIMIYFGAIAAIFGSGYKAGCFYMEIKCTEKYIQEIGLMQREREDLKLQLDLCRNNNSTVTREEFEELKNNINKYNKKDEVKN